jgi:hypothetical protein
MKNLRRVLALAALAAVTACGGGGTNSAVTPTTTKAAARTPDAKGTVTLIFPAHVAKATSGAHLANAKRSPAYINPSGGSLVITAFSNTLFDPANPGNGYFSLGAPNPDGSSTITVPLLSGTYQPGDLTVTEYDGLGGGNELAQGYNAQYTDTNGIVQSGQFTLLPGGTAAPVLTMRMNVGQIVVTTDPVSGSDAQPLSQNFAAPTPFGGTCFSTNTNLYAFAADPSATYVLPGTLSGYTGGDASNQFPGIPTVSLTGEVTNPGGGQQMQLRATALGGNVNQLYDPTFFTGTVEATLQVSNPLGGSVNGYVSISTVGC